MSRPRGKAATVGSEEWLTNEAKLMNELIFADMEDFAYEARRELEWINEHMAEVLDDRQM